MTAGTARRAPPEHPRLGGRPYSTAEIWADGAIHGIGLLATVAGAIILWLTMHQEMVSQSIAVGIYLATLLLSIAASGAYNMWPVSRIKWLLRRLDHSAIYLLIAGTYTPFMQHLHSWRLLTFVWAVATCGIALKVLLPGRYDRLSIVLYLMLGWSGIVISDRIVTDLPSDTVWLTVIGGLVYSSGVVFHLWQRLRFQNAIWHGFVVAAAVIHLFAIGSMVT